MKHLLLTALVLFFFTGLIAQTRSINKSPALTEASPESVGVSAERLARIEQMCEQALVEYQVPGIVLMVVRNGKIVYWKAHSMADNKTGRMMKRDDIFRIASQMKAITSKAVMMLWEEDKFSLDDPILKFIPEIHCYSIMQGLSTKKTD